MPIAYTADADVWCVPHALARYGSGIESRHADDPRGPVLDGEGNPVRPVFRWDDIPDDWYCGDRDCGERIRDL